MQIRFVKGKRYRATIDQKITSPMALAAAQARLEASGFTNLKFEQLKNGTQIEGTWGNQTATVDVAFDVKNVQLVA